MKVTYSTAEGVSERSDGLGTRGVLEVEKKADDVDVSGSGDEVVGRVGVEVSLNPPGPPPEPPHVKLGKHWSLGATSLKRLRLRKLAAF